MTLNPPPTCTAAERASMSPPRSGSAGTHISRSTTASPAKTSRLGRLIVKADLTDPMSGFFMVERSAFTGAMRQLSGQGFKILLDLFASSPRPLALLGPVRGTMAPRPDVQKAPSLAAAERSLAAINTIVVRLSSIALVVAAFVLTYSVIVRYFLKISTDWQDEMSVFLIVGAVFMSAAAIQAGRGHVAIEAIIALLPAHVNMARQILVDAASFLFCAYFAWKSWLLLLEAVLPTKASAATVTTALLLMVI